MTFKTDRTKKIFMLAAGTAMLFLCMLAAFLVCTRKAGLHEDEYYSYYSSNRTDGLWTEGEVSADTILRELTVVKGEGFDFGLVKEVQSWDVHPPVYYFLLHFVCSCMPGVFSKWQGLAINLVSLLICLLLMLYLGRLLIPDRPFTVITVTAAWGCSAAVLTAVAFIRMYMLLTVWILAVTILHVREYRDHRELERIRFYLPLGILTFLGFMTHYYFFIWLFFLAVFYNAGKALGTRRIRGVLYYGLTMVISFGAAYAFYPAWPAQMFRGQRGAQAAGNFFNLSNTWERISFFAEKENRIGFGSLLWAAAAAMVIMQAVILIRRHRSGKDGDRALSDKKKISISINAILIAAFVCYFLAVSKTALMYGDSSIRYQMPVLGAAYMAIASMIIHQAEILRPDSRIAAYAGVLLGILLLGAGIVSDLTGNISFLYPEEKEHEQVIAEYADADMIYVFEPGESWCVWDSANEMTEHGEVAFVPADDQSQMDRTDAADAEEILLYVDTRVDIDPVLHHITQINDGISTFEYLFSNKYCDVYIGR